MQRHQAEQAVHPFAVGEAAAAGAKVGARLAEAVLDG